jgi:hypothetical protein
MPSADLTTIVRTLVAALPDACLRDLCLQLALGLAASPPTPSLAKPAADTHVQRRRGRPRKTAGNGRRRTEAPAKKVDPKLAERRKRYEANRKAKRHAAKAAEVAKASPSTPATGNGETPPVTAQAFWQRCEQIEPTAPWHVPTREFGVRDAVAQQAFRARTLPPRIGPMALNKFLEVQGWG